MREKCFWPAKTIENFNFLKCILVLDLFLNCCSDTKEGILIPLLLYFLVLVKVAAPFIEMSVFHLSVAL